MADTPVETAAVAPVPPVTPGVELTPKVEDDKINQKFEALSRREAELFRHKSQMKQEKMRLQQREQKIQEWETQRQQAQTNPIEALKQLGWTYDQITQYQLSNQVPVDKNIMDVKNEISQFKQEQADKEKKQALAQQQAAQAEATEVINNFKDQIGDFVNTNKDKYELVALHEARDIIYETIEQHWAKESQKYERNPQGPKPKVMNIEEATELVEKYLEDQIEASTKTKKLASRFQPVQTKEVKQEVKAWGESKTLTNNLNSGASPGMLPAKSEDDRMKRALAALNSKR